MAVRESLAKLERGGSSVPLVSVPHALQRTGHDEREVRAGEHEVLDVSQRSLRHECKLTVGALLHAEDKGERGGDGAGHERDAAVFGELNHRQERTLEPVHAPPRGCLEPGTELVLRIVVLSSVGTLGINVELHGIAVDTEELRVGGLVLQRLPTRVRRVLHKLTQQRLRLGPRTREPCVG